MKLTLKGRMTLVLLLLLLVALGGLYSYGWYSGLTLGQVAHKLIEGSSEKPAEATTAGADTEIKARLLEAVFNQAELRKQNISLTVSGGVVTFSGDVDTPQHKAALDQLGQQIAGVKQIINNVAVKAPLVAPVPDPAAQQDVDRQLAEKVEFALYQTDAFELKLMIITARDGRIRLSGNVRSMAEKLLAERIAREVKGVSDVINEVAIEPAK
jgi:hyperosmotically inducible periplasmic protein